MTGEGGVKGGVKRGVVRLEHEKRGEGGRREEGEW